MSVAQMLAGRAGLVLTVLLAVIATSCHLAHANLPVQAYAQTNVNFQPAGFRPQTHQQVNVPSGSVKRQAAPITATMSQQPLGGINQVASMQLQSSPADDLMKQMRAKVDGAANLQPAKATMIKPTANFNVATGRPTAGYTNILPQQQLVQPTTLGTGSQVTAGSKLAPAQVVQQQSSASLPQGGGPRGPTSNGQAQYYQVQSGYPVEQPDQLVPVVSHKKHKNYQDQLEKAQQKLEVKKRLLDLASKATSDLTAADEDSPLLRFNKQTGQYEQVQPNPEALNAKEQLQKALNAISANKLSPKKLGKFLYSKDHGARRWNEPQLTQPDDFQTPTGRFVQRPDARGPQSQQYGSAYVKNPATPSADTYPSQVRQTTVNSRTSPNGDRIRQAANTNIQYSPSNTGYTGVPADQQQQIYVDPRVQDGAATAVSTEVALPEYEDSERAGLVEQVRVGLDDRLNRISDLLYFKPEFLNMLANVHDQAELTPLEGAFKHLVLCVSDEQFCQPELRQLDVISTHPSTPQWISHDEQLISDPLDSADVDGQADELAATADTYSADQYEPEQLDYEQPRAIYSSPSSTGAGVVGGMGDLSLTGQDESDMPDILEDANTWHEEQRDEEDERKKQFYHKSSGNSVSFAQTGDGRDGSPVTKKSHKVTSQATFSRVQSGNARSQPQQQAQPQLQQQRQQQQQQSVNGAAQVNLPAAYVAAPRVSSSNQRSQTAASAIGLKDRVAAAATRQAVVGGPVVRVGPQGNQIRQQPGPVMGQVAVKPAVVAPQGFRMRQ